MSRPAELTTLKARVREFYDRIWNRHDISAVARLLHTDVRFRGSLGSECVGHEGFIEYVQDVHAALGEYHCEISELVAEGGTVVARMLFSGVHRGMILGQAPTQRRVSWSAVAIFHFEDDLIRDLWVLGDVANLLLQLSNGDFAPKASTFSRTISGPST